MLARIGPAFPRCRAPDAAPRTPRRAPRSTARRPFRILDYPDAFSLILKPSATWAMQAATRPLRRLTPRAPRAMLVRAFSAKPAEKVGPARTRLCGSQLLRAAARWRALCAKARARALTLAPRPAAPL